MAQLIRSPDTADRLRIDLEAAARLHDVDLHVACTPLPVRFDEHLPFAWIRMLGGSRRHVVVDTATLTVGVYAATWRQTMETALDAHALVAALPYERDTLTDWKTVGMLNLPYEDPDPDHPSLPRCSFTLTAVVKATVL